MKPNLVIGALFALSVSASDAVTLSFASADLYKNPNVTLPSTNQGLDSRRPRGFQVL